MQLTESLSDNATIKLFLSAENIYLSPQNNHYYFLVQVSYFMEKKRNCVGI